ncbi:uncharacterized protein [Rhodnius prolixus]|uniref:uncharacterized protein n=1 Tax=Rhodnius prolixus TaxID=13249 RepID=UPI003D18B040
MIPRVLPAKLFINGNPSKKDVKHQSNVNIPTNQVGNQVGKKKKVCSQFQLEKVTKTAVKSALLARSRTTQQFLVLSSSARSHGINTGDTQSTACKTVIHGSQSDKDVKDQSNMNVPTNIG